MRSFYAGLFVFTSIVAALYLSIDDNGVMWPFNKPTFSFSLLCRNTADAAEKAAKSRDSGYPLKEFLIEFSRPVWQQKENSIQRQEYISAAILAYSNPNVSPGVIHDMQADICEAKRAYYLDQFSKN
ncbi:hypothetical protein [Pseudovibrio sp. Ad37]|uniref:hypothetical protein n=1 Tax=Pseudovibrio sp. Ad37 TaxID=989422 RepID=UPI0007AED41D|nr:hypothetical protein [Pseudovibrio sp. Ad37]